MSIEERLAALETELAETRERLGRVEDTLAITDLVYRYGAAIDTGSADAVLALFTDDGVYDVDTGTLTGAAEIGAMVDGAAHQRLVGRGCAHVMSAPQIQVDGDVASVVSYSQLVLRAGDDAGYTVLRATANHWRLARTTGGWRVTHRTARKIDGSDAVHAVLGAHLDAAQLNPTHVNDD